MANSSQSQVEKKLAALQAEFKRTLPERVRNIEQSWNLVLADKATDSTFIDCYRMAHTLVGTGGTFGAIIITTVSRELEQNLKPLLKENTPSTASKKQITDLVLKLKDVVDKWQPSKIPYLQPVEVNEKSSRDLIYLAEDDELLAADLVVQLEEADFRVEHFSGLDSFETAFSKEVPDAVIMDIVFREGSIAGSEVISRLQKKMDKCPPVIFISVRNDMEARLSAARAGAQRYFCKPLDVKKIIPTLNGLIERTITKPFRILLVDDDVSLLNYYETVIHAAGMEVKTISNPMDALNTLEEFEPDVIVLDVYMPECSGPELAQVIRQDDTWALTPIMFLSTESDLNIQLDAMNLGGESFMVKPVTASHLLSAITAKAKRARWTNRLKKDLEMAVREGEFQLITSNQHDIVSATDVAGRIISANDKFCKISGYSKEELIGRNHRLLKSKYHSDEFFKEMWDTISSGKVWHGTICNLTKTGDEYWVNSTIVPFLDEKGKPYKYVSARTDVTKVIQSEERLQRSQEFANIGTWDWSIETGSLFWSERIWPLFGYDKEVTETTYDNFMAAIHPGDRKLVSDAVTSCVEKGAEYNIEHRVVWPDGSIHWLHESGDVVRDKEGKPLHMLGVVQDITLRKKAEIALSENERQLVAAQSMARVGNWQADLSTGDLIWSDEIYRVFGYEPGSFEPSVEAFHQGVHPDDLSMVIESEKRAEKTGWHDVEHRILQPDGTVRYVHELAEAEIDEEGHLIRMAGTVQDITERKLAEQSLIDAREDAETANRAKSQFLSSMSHELRTPMNAIMGFGQLLNLDIGNPLDDSQKENVTEILKASDHLLELINEVLDLAKIEAGRIDLSIEDVLLGDVIGESLQLILPLVDKRGISIKLIRANEEITIDELVKEQSIVRADYTRMKQVIINFLSNAVKYNSENGNITITCNKNDNNTVRISISDTGQGLSQEQQAQLFTAFNRLGAENTEIEGTGIGLVITQNIIELMGGNLGVESELGVGSTFWFELPTGLDNASNTGATAQNTTTDIEIEEPRSVLYIEDNPANLRLVTQLLGRLPNLNMWTAHEPILGLDLAEEHDPDLILLDINLPGMDGFEVLKILRKREATCDTPIIAISANAMPKDIVKGIDAGFDDYITKPIDINRLLLAVEKSLTK